MSVELLIYTRKCDEFFSILDFRKKIGDLSVEDNIYIDWSDPDANIDIVRLCKFLQRNGVTLKNKLPEQLYTDFNDDGLPIPGIDF